MEQSTTQAERDFARLTVVDFDQMRVVQDIANAWQREQFGDTTTMQALAGVTEEVGELAHALLKTEQNIRQDKDHDAEGQDAIGDIVMYLMHVCMTKGWDFGDCVRGALKTIIARDWREERGLSGDVSQVRDGAGGDQVQE